MNYPFARDATLRGAMPAGKNKSGFAATQEPHEWENEAIYRSVTDHIWGTQTQVTNGEATLFTDGSGNPLDKDSVAVVFADDDKILIAHDVAATGNIILLGGTNRFVIEMFAGVTMDMATFNLTIGESGDSFRGSINVTGTGTATIHKPQDLLVDSGSMTLVGIDGHFNGEVPDFESTNLIINVQSNTTVDADADRLSFINSANIAAFNDNIDETFTMPTDLMAGTSEKASHWYQMWIDSLGVQLLVPDLESAADGTTTNKLVDSAATFETDLVQIGDRVYNLTDLTQTTVTAIDSETVLSLASDIFVSGENYKIRMLSPTGLGASKARIGAAFNNAASNFGNSYYTQIQEEKFYLGDKAGLLDFAVSGTPAISTVILATGSVRQILDWTGKGIWKYNFNYVLTVASASRTTALFASTDITFKIGTTLRQPISSSNTNGIVHTESFANSSTADMIITHASASTVQYMLSGDVELELKPGFHN